jgi:hypothetical protein
MAAALRAAMLRPCGAFMCGVMLYRVVTMGRIVTLIHRNPSPPKPGLVASDPLRNLTPFGPDDPSPAPFARGHGGLKNGRVQRSRADIIRKFLECTKRAAKDEYGRTRLEQMIANMLEIAKSPKHPHAVAAFVALCDRAYGRPRPSQEKADAIAKGGITLVYVNRPKIDPDIPFAVPALPASAPEFDEESSK